MESVVSVISVAIVSVINLHPRKCISYKEGRMKVKVRERVKYFGFVIGLNYYYYYFRQEMIQ